jgi:citrate synthase
MTERRPPRGGDGSTPPLEWTTGLGNGVAAPKIVAGVPLEDLTRNHTYAEVIWLIIRKRLPEPTELRLFEACLCAIVDQGYRNTVATVARFSVSASGEPIPAIAAGIASIGRHTAGAQTFVAEYLGELVEADQAGDDLERLAEELVRSHRVERRAVPGFGTKFHRELGHDPRSVTLFDIADGAGFADTAGRTAFAAVQRALEQVLGRPVVVNIDGAMGVVFYDLGFTPHDIAALEAVVMMPSIIGHTLEELREGTPMRLLPDEMVAYTGPWPEGMS